MRRRCSPPPPPGDPEDPASWAGYARLAPHVLATAPLGDHDAASRRLVLDTIRYLQVRRDSHAGRVVGEPLLDRWRAIRSPDHPDTLTAASTLTLARAQLGEAKPARALGEDSLQRCRRVLGPDHLLSLWTATALNLALNRLGEVKPARALGRDTLQRCRRVLGPDHPITVHLTRAASSGHPVTSDDAATDSPDRPL